MSFNGGKMQHIFQMVKDQYGNNVYQPEFTCPEAKEAFEQGEFFFKIDGANGMVITDSHNQVKLYERYDDKKAKLDPNKLPANFICLPGGQNPEMYQSENKWGQVNHHYYYKYMDPQQKGKLGQIHQELYRQLSSLAEQGELEPNQHYSVELVGQKYQKTPGVNVDATVAFHRRQQVHPSQFPSLTFDGVHQYLRTVKVEGLVVKHLGKYWKIRSNLMPGGEAECPFTRYRQGQARPEDENLPLITPSLL